MPILSPSLVENESFASDVRASFRWKNIYSIAMEKDAQCADRVPPF